MLYIKQKIHLKKQKIALDKTIKNLLGDLVKSECYFKDNFLYIYIDNEYLLQDELNLILPSFEDISQSAKKIYKHFDDTKAKKVIYTFDALRFRQQKLDITAKGSNLNFFGCYFKDIKVEDADEILIFNNNINKQIVRKMELTTKEKITIYFADRIEVDEDIILNSNEINCCISYFEAHLGNINLSAKEINLSDCSIEANKINITADKFLTNVVRLIANKEININNKNCDEIKNVYAPKIIYNKEDITNSDSIVKPKINKMLIKVLKKIKSNLEKEIQLETNKYKKQLNNKPISKILKK